MPADAPSKASSAAAVGAVRGAASSASRLSTVEQRIVSELERHQEQADQLITSLTATTQAQKKRARSPEGMAHDAAKRKRLDGMLQDMNLLCRSLPAAERTHWRTVARELESRADTTSGAPRAAAAAAGAGPSSQSQTISEWSDYGHRVQERTLETVTGMTRTLERTKASGAATAEELARQGDVLLEIDEAVRDVDEAALRAGQVLKIMMRRLSRDPMVRFLAVTIVALLVFTITWRALGREFSFEKTQHASSS